MQPPQRSAGNPGEAGVKRKRWPLVMYNHEIVRSAGGIVFRIDPSSGDTNPRFEGVNGTGDGRLQVLLIHRKQHNDWSFPKGRVEAGETADVAALREVFEESACQCTLEQELATVRYMDRNHKPKEVRFWKMLVEDEGTFVPNNEVDRIRWLTLLEAFAMLSYKTDRLLLKKTFA